MHISEMRGREDFDAILMRTLETAWAREQGHPVTVRLATEGGEGQHWRYHPLHSAYTVEKAGPAVRRFLANNIRYTSRRWRRPAQWLAGTILSTSAGLALSHRPGVRVDPPVTGGRDMVLLPGNGRIRLFDLASGLTRVYLKDGFSNTLMAREIALRSTGAEGPFPAIGRHDDAATWFEEPLLEGWCLARCPASVDARPAVARAVAELTAWSLASSREVVLGPYLEGLLTRIRAALTTLNERFQLDVSPWNGWLEALVEHAGEGSARVGLTHGDLQSGNIMVDRGGQEATLIDWEHWRERMLPYDSVVFGLNVRSHHGLADRLVNFTSGAPCAWLTEDHGQERKSMVARFLLEDTTFVVEEAAAGPYRGLTLAVRDRMRVLGLLGPQLEALWRA